MGNSKSTPSNTIHCYDIDLTITIICWSFIWKAE